MALQQHSLPPQPPQNSLRGKVSLAVTTLGWLGQLALVFLSARGMEVNTPVAVVVLVMMMAGTADLIWTWSRWRMSWKLVSTAVLLVAGYFAWVLTEQLEDSTAAKLAQIQSTQDQMRAEQQKQQEQMRAEQQKQQEQIRSEVAKANERLARVEGLLKKAGPAYANSTDREQELLSRYPAGYILYYSDRSSAVIPYESRANDFEVERITVMKQEGDIISLHVPLIREKKKEITIERLTLKIWRKQGARMRLTTLEDMTQVWVELLAVEPEETAFVLGFRQIQK